MFSLPKTRTPLPWYQQPHIRRWLADLFALTSRKRTYTLQLGGGRGLAWVAPELRRVYVTTKLPDTDQGHLRFDPRTPDGRRELMLKGFIAHEAGHVRHSHRKPEGKVGRIWNCIEDERMERLMAAEYPELQVAFTFLGDIVCEIHRPKWSHTAMEGVLVWRFEHDRLTPRWQPRKEDRSIWDTEIRPRVEAGWVADNSQEVERLSREINDLLKAHQEELSRKKQAQPPAPQTPPPPQDPQDAPEPEPDTPDDESDPSQEPDEPQEQEGNDSQDSEDQPEGGEGQESRPSEDDSAEGGEENGDTSGDAQGSEDDAEEGGEGTTPGEDGDGEDGSPGQSGEDQPGEDGAAGEGEGNGTSGDSQEGEDGEGGGGEDNSPQEEDSGPVSNVSEEEQAAENADEDHEPGTWEEVSASGTDASERDGEAEDEAADAGGEGDPQQEDETPRPSRQGGLGAGLDGELPRMPIPDRGTGEIIAKGVEGHARNIAPLLRPLEKPGQTRPHRNKGRYDYRRDLRDAERVFLKKTEPTRPMPLTVKLLIDISVSMEGEPLEAARQAAVMLVRAAALCGSKAEIHLFNTGHRPVITQPMPYTDAIGLISAVTTEGGTTLHPSLKTLSETPANPYEIEMIIVICDGLLRPDDYAQCKRIIEAGRGAGKRYLPVLIGDAADTAPQWKEVFGSALPCRDVNDIARNIRAALTAQRGRVH